MYSNAMKVQTALIEHNFGATKAVRLQLHKDRPLVSQKVRLAAIEEAAVFEARDSMPFGDTEALFDDVDWELGRLIAGSYGRGL